MISPIYSSPIHYSNNYKPRSKSPSFTAHPDLARLSQYFTITASSYFRRGPYFGLPAEEFTDVAKVLESVMNKHQGQKKSMLIVGVGSSQEPFSYLAVIKSGHQNRSLNRNLDLYTVDMQSKPTLKELFINSFSDSRYYPKYAGDSFVYDAKNQGLFADCHYRVSDEIFDYLAKTYDNPYKSKWDTRIQDVAASYPSKKFDIISINNTLPYIGDNPTIIDTIIELKRALRPGGYFITDPKKLTYMHDKQVLENMREIRPGIYKKMK